MPDSFAPKPNLARNRPPALPPIPGSCGPRPRDQFADALRSALARWSQRSLRVWAALDPRGKLLVVCGGFALVALVLVVCARPLERGDGPSLTGIPASSTSIAGESEKAFRRDAGSPTVAIPASAPRFRYVVTDLGTLGGKTSRAKAINNKGQVVGKSATGNTSDYSTEHAFLWEAGKGMQDLGTLGGKRSEATGINDAGQVVGSSETDNTSDYLTAHAFLWQSDKGMQDLGTLGGRSSRAVGINNKGQIIGTSETWVVPGYPLSARAYSENHLILWQAGSGMQDLGTVNEERFDPTGINDSGQVIGVRTIGTGDNRTYCATLWEAGSGVKVVGKLSYAMAINNRGQVVGGGESKSAHSFLWQVDEGTKDLGGLTGRLVYSGPAVKANRLDGGETWDLGTLTGGNVAALGINNRGQVVGVAFPADDRSDPNTHPIVGTAFLYTDGKITNVNTMIDPASGWLLEEAVGINDVGQIVGAGTNKAGQLHSFLLTPVGMPDR